MENQPFLNDFPVKCPLRVDFHCQPWKQPFDLPGAVRKAGGPMLRGMFWFNLAKNLAGCSRGTAAKPHRNMEQTGADVSVSLRYHGIYTLKQICVYI
jgi:hypothetical protein